MNYTDTETVDERPSAYPVVKDLCHTLGVDINEVMGIYIAPGAIDVLLKTDRVLDDGAVGMWRRFKMPMRDV